VFAVGQAHRIERVAELADLLAQRQEDRRIGVAAKANATMIVSPFRKCIRFRSERLRFRA
jgi:hypothetical protein